jgi:hypothetical protein
MQKTIRLHCQERIREKNKYPFECIFSNMEIASIAIQATISTDIEWELLFQTSHRLGPNMSIICI